MRHYIANLHTKSVGEKRRFALLVSGIFTLGIFTMWSLVTFGGLSKPVAVNQDKPGEITLEGDKEPSPFTTLGSGLASSFAAFKQGINNAKSQLENLSSQDIKYGQ